ncbi:hypothetical protein [Streptomyces sp. TLI_171]|uniref:hypothetical protein n=1 Tax=Streptomyces sp. TLI_171 TaxID=1938859 RepID=UPI000C482DC5|nr:hypothetical protein [Streptomyces sp. TLI_171]RKE18581.1 hypothetical protein BX266_1874 [Streptomyces sp. TLI_171]
MRGRIVLAVAVAALLLGGCGAERTGTAPIGRPQPGLITAGPEVRPATGAAAVRAAEITAAWPGSAAAEAWEHGYYPVEDTTEWLPADAFHDGADKLAYGDGRFDLRTGLPVTFSGAAQVEFADGSRLTLPLRSAQDTYTSLTHRSDSCAADCGHRLTVTAVRPGTTTVATSRGRATVPVWEFTVAGYDQPFRYPAVLSQRPPVKAEGWVGDGTATTLRSVSADGLVLTATVPFGCDTVGPGTVHETDRAVVLIGRTTPQALGPDEACPAMLGYAPVEFRLARPLGDRVVLGLVDGLPQLPATGPSVPQ